MRALVIVVLLALAGCGSKEKAADNAAAAMQAPGGPRLGEVPLDQPIRATDAALTWSLEIAPGEISLTRFSGEGGEGAVTEFYPVAPRVDGDTAVWTTKDPAGAVVTIRLARTTCAENGEPAIDRPLTAELHLGDRILRGCAGARPADGLDSQPENAADTNLADNVAGTAR